MDSLEKHIRVNDLYFVYKNLLTERQQSIIHDYYENNYTLSEIASNENISRNAVHDQLQKTLKKLESFEAKLGLLKKQEKRLSIIQAIQSKTNDQTILDLLESLEKVD